MRHLAPPHLAFLICSIWLCRKLLCFKYLLATGSAAYHFRQRQSQHRRRNQRPPAAEGQALRGARLKALLALDFAYVCVAIRAIHSSRCISAGPLVYFIQARNFSVVVRANLTVNMPLRIRVGVHRVFPLTLEPILWTGVGQEKRKRMAGKRSSLSVRGSRVELPRLLRHYLLRVARLPISPPAHQNGLQIYEMFSNSQKGGAISSGA